MRCEGVKADGVRCQIVVADGTAFCIWHDPSQAGRRRAASARKRGAKAGHRKKLEGRIKTLPDETSPSDPGTEAEIASYLSWTTGEVRRGGLDARTGDTIGKLLNAQLRALKESKTADEIAELRAQLAEIQRSSVGVVR